MTTAAIVTLGGCGGTEPAPPAQPQSLRVGASFWPGQFWVDIAHHRGWFAEAGLKVEWVDTNADYFASLEDVAAGRLDVAAFALFDLVAYETRDADLVGFLASDTSAGAESLIARPGIAHVRDLAGRRLGLSKGTYLEYLWHLASERAHLDPGSVQIVDLQSETAGAALASGTVDAILAWEPFAGEALAAVGGRRLFSTAEIPGALWAVYATRREVVETRGEEIAAFVRVWRRTDAWMRANPAEALAIVAQVNGRPVEAVRAMLLKDQVLDVGDNRRAFAYAPGFDSLHGAARRFNDFQLGVGATNRRVDTARMLRGDFVHALSDEMAP